MGPPLPMRAGTQLFVVGNSTYSIQQSFSKGEAVF